MNAQIIVTKSVSVVFYASAAVIGVAAIKIPALFLITAFLCFCGYVVWSASPDRVSTTNEDVIFDDEFGEDPDGPIDMQIAGGYGTWGSTGLMVQSNRTM